MHSLNNESLQEILSIVDPKDLIPVIEKGIEIESVENIITKSKISQRRIKASRFLLCFLRARFPAR